MDRRNRAKPVNKTLIYNGQKCLTQTFHYIIVIDFEATCWTEVVQETKTQEIIEFPAVLLNLKNGKIESEFHRYVKPTENPRLSVFCSKLTGIRQEDVDAGVPLRTCLTLFDEWLKQILLERNLTLPKTDPKNPEGNVAFATWTNNDFNRYLRVECARKYINKPEYFNRWMNIKQIYMNCYHGSSRDGFKDALNNLGIQFIGRQHSGLDDARNLCTMILLMIKEGIKLHITIDITSQSLQ